MIRRWTGGGTGGLTSTGEIVAPDFSSTGLAPASNPGRFIGVTTSGAPASGTWRIGDYSYDLTGAGYFCTSAGTPGTWAPIGSGIELAFAADSNVNNVTATTNTAVDLSGCTITFTVGSRPVHITGTGTLMANNTAGRQSMLLLTDNANTEKDRDLFFSEGISHGRHPLVFERIATPGTYTRKLRISNNAASADTATAYTSVDAGYSIRAVSA